MTKDKQTQVDNARALRMAELRHACQTAKQTKDARSEMSNNNETKAVTTIALVVIAVMVVVIASVVLSDWMRTTTARAERVALAEVKEKKARAIHEELRKKWMDTKNDSKDYDRNFEAYMAAGRVWMEAYEAEKKAEE